MCVKNNVKMFPIKFVLLFLIVTEILFFVGPINWQINNNILIIFFFLIVNIALYWGYRCGLKLKKRRCTPISNNKLDKIIFFTLLITLLRIYFSFGTLSISTIYDQTFYAIHNPGEVYYAKTYETSIPRLILMSLLALPQYIGMVSGCFYWKRLSKLYKILYAVILILEIASWLSIGVRKGIFDILIIIFASYFARSYSIVGSKNVRKYYKYFFLVVCFFLMYFTYSTVARYGTNVDFYKVLNIKESYYDVPEYIILPLYFVSIYLCQGYYALDKAFDIGIIQPNIFNTNFFTINVLERIDPSIMDGSYLSLLERNYGIDPLASWHSIYVWLANGFTFLGVPFVIFIIGYYFAKSWMSSIYEKNIISVSLFAIHFQMIMYFFANNQVYSFSFVVIVGLFVLFFFRDLCIKF